MCGISIWLDRRQLDEDLFKKSVSIINHRGPDYSNTYFPTKLTNNLALGHARLSIIDLTESGNQPMTFDRKNLSIVYNGEIYNYIELRKELEEDGFTFNSNSDTEVILASFKKWGKECLNRFNGMFAFGIFDRKSNSIFIARDRFGIKPLYYKYKKGAHFLAGSEIKQLTLRGDFKSKINWDIAVDFVKDRLFDHSSETFFEGIEQLRGGEAMEVFLDDIKMHKFRWYNLEETANSKPCKISFNDAKEEFNYLLNKSVKYRIHADVKVGSCLSGGLDSSTLVCLANKQLSESGAEHLQNTFSSCFEDNRFDEREYIEEVTKFTKANSHYTFPNIDNFWKNIDKIIWHQDEPVWSTSMYAQWEVFRLAKENDVKVILDGQGADELLAGYANMFEYASLISRSRDSISDSIKLFPRIIKKRLGYMKNSMLGTDIGFIDKKYNKGNQFCPYKYKSVREISIDLLKKYHLPALLHYEDRNSMANSVESRVPFLDHELVEFSLSIPDEYKLNDLFSKYILRKSMKGYVPNKVVNRTDKMGFVTPQQVWMFGKHKDKFKNILRAGSSLKPFNEKLVLDSFDDMAAGKIPFNGTLWRIIALQKWIEIFNISH